MIGGVPAKEQMRVLQEGVDVVTGTPGRLDDFISTGKLDLSGVGGACCPGNTIVNVRGAISGLSL